MKNKKFFVVSLLACLASILACCIGKRADSSNHTQDEQPSVIDSTNLPEQKSKTDTIRSSARTSDKAKFKVPYGIEKSRLVVAFYDSLCTCPVAIVYDDSKKTKATKIIYNTDGSLSKKKLVPLSSFEFGERFEDFPEDKPHWDVYPAIVKYVHTNGSIGATFEVLEVE